jgi:acetyl-CoA C-acetyltransferase
MRKTLLLGANRTPIGSFSGMFSSTSAVDLGTSSAKAALARSGIAANQIDEVIMGNVLQAGQGQNPARQIAIGAGIPKSVSSFAVNKLCGSGMKSLMLGWQSIALNRANAVLAGGTESMTQAPFLLPAMRNGARLGHTEVQDSLLKDGLLCAFNEYHMGITAENIVEQYGITREEQDAFSLHSQLKCGAALEAGRFVDEISPITITQCRKEVVIDSDEYPKPDSTEESFAKLRPAFKKDGTVTAGSSSGINDGASTMILAAEDSLPEGANVAGAVYLHDVRTCGCSPETMGLGPIGAVQELLEHNNLSVDDIDLWELNEAFAVQSLAVMRDINVNPDLVNVNGGAIALGHPIGCSGSRIVTTLIHELNRRGGRYGIAAMCIGGGMGIGCLIESTSVSK